MPNCLICEHDRIAKPAVYHARVHQGTAWAPMCRLHYVLHGSRTDALNDLHNMTLTESDIHDTTQDRLGLGYDIVLPSANDSHPGEARQPNKRGQSCEQMTKEPDGLR